MWFWLSLIAILFWSGSDLFSKMGSKKNDVYSHWKMVMAVGTVMGIHAIVMIALGTEFQLKDMITYLPASVLYISSMTLGYVGLRYIVLSVSTPICNSSGAVACILCYFFLKQNMTALQIVAVILICVSIFLLAVIEKKQEDKKRQAQGIKVDKKHTHSFIAIFFPIFYCILDGIGTFTDALLLDRYIAEGPANIAYEFTFLLMAVIAFVYVVIIKKQKIFIGKEKPKIVAALCETAGQFAYIFAIGKNAVVAAPLISSYCLVSLIWARIILKEKLTAKQYVLIALAGVGIVIMGME